MSFLKRAICFTAVSCMTISNCCVAFADTNAPRRDKEAVVTCQEELDLLNELREERRSLVKKEKDGKEQPIKKIETRATIFEERENNDTFSRADLLYYGERFKGYIDDEDDEDIFEIEFDEDGTVLFELWSIPSDCDYDLTVYDEDYDRIDFSNNSDNDREEIIIAVEANKSYFVLIESYSGYDEEDHYYVDVECINPAYCLAVGVNYLANYVDTSDDAKLFADDMEEIGFTSKVLKSVQYDDWEDTFLENGGPKFLEADVIMLAGHGSMEGIFFNYKEKGGDYATGVTYGSSRPITFEDEENDVVLETYQMAGLGDFDVEDTVLAVLCGCSTAAGGIGGFAGITSVDHGVDCVIGWGNTIKDPDAEEWLNKFGYYLAEGKSIRMAAYYANTEGDYEYEDLIVDGLQILNEESDSFDLILEEYAEDKSDDVWMFDNQSVSNRMANLLGKEVSIEQVKELRENASDCKLIQVTDSVGYSVNDKDLGEVITYIKENLNENFDIDQYEAVTDVCNVVCNDEIVETSIRLNLKKGDFVTEEGYYIVIKDGFVDMIFVDGNPEISQDNVIQTFTVVDEEELKEDALKEIKLADNEEIEYQKVYKKYDTEPYYDVMTVIRNTTNGFSRVESYEYR